jgi:hypothetical protein
MSEKGHLLPGRRDSATSWTFACTTKQGDIAPGAG